MTRVRFGILGCADIAVRKLIPGILASETAELYAVASRDRAKAEEVANRFGARRAYGSYDELLEDPNVDAVYIPLPNHLHKPWTLKAAARGKHVLCEKPLALDAREAQEMVDACRAHQVKLAEAFMYRHHPRYRRVLELVAQGAIGPVRGIRGSFTFNNAADRGNIRYRRDWGGGSLYDVGCYPISAARLILGEEPEAVAAHAFFSPEHDGVDMYLSGLVEFANGVSLIFDCGMWAAARNELEVIGADGRLTLERAFLGEPVTLRIEAGGEARVETFEPLDPYALEVDDLGRAILEGAPLAFPPEDAIANMRVLEACLESARTRQRVRVAR
ncbi:Gfo/Idh/MocA family protein [Alicyclobacillus vulcanalis]|uniref:Predicted dehydrogenase n=1 Tax=Alicyclobacillus vulcanalis TaxID=252246 RepID=A0A1N7JKV4_9BACL|nr:Gfo/Idh/MocA family oxidoreductase [Alicyclobacillus vulcanalis]SIS49945.1 Predicted dehydrogenase [Alicyclobacillus vulcanalis]